MPNLKQQLKLKLSTLSKLREFRLPRRDKRSENEILRNSLGPGDTLSRLSPARLGAVIALPFILPLLLFLNPLYIMLYVCFIFVYVVGIFTFCISEVTIRPPWYRPTTPAEGLTDQGIPEYWQGIYHDPKYDLDLPYENVEFRTLDDRLTLRGWYVPAKRSTSTTASSSSSSSSSSNTSGHHSNSSSGNHAGHSVSAHLSDSDSEVGVVAVHGGGRDRRAFLRHVPIFHSLGMPVLLFDFSEHGVSDGSNRGFSYGVREQDDVTAAVQWMRKVKGSKRVIVIGTSVGATSVLLAAAYENSGIDLIIAENPLTRPEELIVFHMARTLAQYLPKVHKDHTILGWFLSLFVFVFQWRIGAIFPRSRPNLNLSGTSNGSGSTAVSTGSFSRLISAVEAAPRISCPVFVMHGDTDEVIPFEHSIRIHANLTRCTQKELWIAKNVPHCCLYDKYPDEYIRRVVDFMLRQGFLTNRVAVQHPAVVFLKEEAQNNSGSLFDHSTDSTKATVKAVKAGASGNGSEKKSSSSSSGSDGAKSGSGKGSRRK